MFYFIYKMYDFTQVFSYLRTQIRVPTMCPIEQPLAHHVHSHSDPHFLSTVPLPSHVHHTSHWNAKLLSLPLRLETHGGILMK